MSGCATAPAATAPAPWKAAAPAATTVAPEREVRYYRDETGALWDDRGRRVAASP